MIGDCRLMICEVGSYDLFRKSTINNQQSTIVIQYSLVRNRLAKCRWNGSNERHLCLGFVFCHATNDSHAEPMLPEQLSPDRGACYVSPGQAKPALAASVALGLGSRRIHRSSPRGSNPAALWRDRNRVGFSISMRPEGLRASLARFGSVANRLKCYQIP